MHNFRVTESQSCRVPELQKHLKLELSDSELGQGSVVKVTRGLVGRVGGDTEFRVTELQNY